ncbi:hypothetical protein NLI96_g4549 [Meripilus lineatus]|uniref:Uncharacterized protein n=1 Tax=Meripilus lineatus TaxID=2056292 RepID=A0AAD5V4N7_9APHY|nr:hypothetical protein NLI96_g4549 [Physisporinus lineatus]
MTPSTPASPPPIDTISPTPSSEKEKYDPEEYLSRATEIQVSMLIAMPDPNHHQHHHQTWDRQESDMYKSLKGKERSLDRDRDDDSDSDANINAEEGVPDVVFGIARIPFRNPTPEITYPPT